MLAAASSRLHMADKTREQINTGENRKIIGISFRAAAIIVLPIGFYLFNRHSKPDYLVFFVGCFFLFADIAALVLEEFNTIAGIVRKSENAPRFYALVSIFAIGALLSFAMLIL